MINKIKIFLDDVGSGIIEVYNKFSLQFERNVSRYKYPGAFTKREIDLVMEPLSGGLSLDCAIELKFPRNGQVPEQMFKFCEDLAFLEELKQGGCNNAYFLALADDPQFWTG